MHLLYNGDANACNFECTFFCHMKISLSRCGRGHAMILRSRFKTIYWHVLREHCISDWSSPGDNTYPSIYSGFIHESASITPRHQPDQFIFPLTRFSVQRTTAVALKICCVIFTSVHWWYIQVFPIHSKTIWSIAYERIEKHSVNKFSKIWKHSSRAVLMRKEN